VALAPDHTALAWVLLGAVLSLTIGAAALLVFAWRLCGGFIVSALGDAAKRAVTERLESDHEAFSLAPPRRPIMPPPDTSGVPYGKNLMEEDLS